MSTLRKTERIAIIVMLFLIAFVLIWKTIAGFYFGAVNNAYQEGFIDGAQLNAKPNVCKVNGGYYQITFKDGNIFLNTKQYSQIPMEIIEEFTNPNSYYYQASVNVNGQWKVVMMIMNYDNKNCNVGTAFCGKSKECSNFTKNENGVLVEKP